MIYGYARISTRKQDINRQIRNIMAVEPNAKIIQEAYTGTKVLARPKWADLLKKVKSGDTIIFDEVSRMARNASEGYAVYEDLYKQGVNLIFIKEPHINTETYTKAINGGVPLTGTNVDCILEGVNKYLLTLAKEQIRLAFVKAEEEVVRLRERTKEGIETARLNGKQIGGIEGKRLVTKKSIAAKNTILTHAKDFGGNLSDVELMKLTGLARNTYYKYKRELREAKEGE